MLNHASTADDWFDQLDTDGDGQLGPRDLQRALDDLGMAPQPGEARRVIALLDRSGSGHIDRVTFYRFLRGNAPAPDPDAELRATFRLLDHDGDGFLTAPDIAQAPDIDHAEARAIVRAADVDGDGRLSFREFRTALAGL